MSHLLDALFALPSVALKQAFLDGYFAGCLTIILAFLLFHRDRC